MKAPSKAAKDEIALYKKVGWTYVGIDGQGHPAIQHPRFGRYAFPGTASDWRSMKNSRATVARIMGIELGELEKRMGVKQVKTQDAATRKARRKKGQRKRVMPVAAAPRPEPTPEPEDEEPEVMKLRRRYIELRAKADAERISSPLLASLTQSEFEAIEPADLKEMTKDLEAEIEEQVQGREYTCLWCGAPIVRPPGTIGHPPATCPDKPEEKRALDTLRQWFRPMRISTREEVVRAQEIRDRHDRFKERATKPAPPAPKPDDETVSELLRKLADRLEEK